MSTRIERLREQLTVLEARREAERAEMADMADAEELSDVEEARWAELTGRFEARDGAAVWVDDAEIAKLGGEVARLEAILSAPARTVVPAAPHRPAGSGGGSALSRRDDVWSGDVRQIPQAEAREWALRTGERTLWSSTERDALAERLARIQDPRGILARHIVASGRPEYRSAFAKVLSHQASLLTSAEAEAMAEVRALSLTDAAGGYGVPFTLDPTIIDTGTHLQGPWRQIASVVQTVSDNWQGVSSAGVTASMVGEATEATDGSPTFAQPTVSLKKSHAFVPFSVEIEMDFAGDLATQLREMFAVAREDLEDAQLAVGSGSGNNVTGLITGLVAASATVTSTTTDVFAVADLYKTEQALQQRSRGRAVWVGNKSVYNLIRQFGTSDSHALWTRLGDGQPERLLSYPGHESPSMDGTINAAAENYILVFGDVREAFKIVDRVGLTVDLVPHLFGTTNNYPTGQRGLYMYWRWGANVVNSAVAKVLNVT